MNSTEKIADIVKNSTIKAFEQLLNAHNNSLILNKTKNSKNETVINLNNSTHVVQHDFPKDIISNITSEIVKNISSLIHDTVKNVTEGLLKNATDIVDQNSTKIQNDTATMIVPEENTVN